MADTKVSTADYTDMTNIVGQRTVEIAQQDYPGYRYSPDWTKWFGYYKTIPELHAAINKKAIWTLGRGYEVDTKTKAILERVRGNGKDTFNDIMFNCLVQAFVGGDSFAEIIKNKRGELKNLKPINPGSMIIESNEKGIITKFEQTVRSQLNNKNNNIVFKPDQIFYLPWNRLGDEPHGRSTIEKLVDVIDSRNESMKDMRVVFHRYVKPLIISKIDSDDNGEIAAFKAKLDKAVLNMENLIIPKDTVEMDRMSIPQYSTLDPLPWLRQLQEYFIMSEGVPEVILGFGRETTEASAKILYLAFQQNIEHAQRWLEAQIKAQLKLDVKFNFPVDLAAHMEGDMRKEGNVGFEGSKPARKPAKEPAGDKK